MSEQESVQWRLHQDVQPTFLSRDDEPVERPPRRRNTLVQIDRPLRFHRAPVDGHECPAQTHSDFLVQVRQFRAAPHAPALAIPKLLKNIGWKLADVDLIELNEAFGLAHQELLPTPLLSAFFDGPMQKGRDLIYGGALYNASGTTHIGFADTVDSLNAIEKAVFLDKICTFSELLNALRADYKAEKLPLPKSLMGIGLEIVAQRVAGLLRNNIETEYKK